VSVRGTHSFKRAKGGSSPRTKGTVPKPADTDVSGIFNGTNG